MSAARRISSHPDDSSPVLRRHAGGTMGQGGRLVLTDARSSAPRPFHLMAKPTGAVCNLDCEYCFYLAKESLYPGSDFRMPDDMLERYVAGLLAAHAGLPEVVVAFQGGEPTMMGLDFFRRVLELEQQYAEPGQADPQHPPDERHAPRRRLGGVPRRPRLPRGGVDRRPARPARRLPRRQGRQAHLRPRHGRARRAEAPWRRVERAHRRQLRERRARPRGLPVPSRRPGRAVHPAHPDRGA